MAEARARVPGVLVKEKAESQDGNEEEETEADRQGAPTSEEEVLDECGDLGALSMPLMQYVTALNEVRRATSLCSLCMHVLFSRIILLNVCSGPSVLKCLYQICSASFQLFRLQQFVLVMPKGH